MKKDDLQFDSIIGIMLILQAKFTQNIIAAVQQFQSSCFTGSIFSDKRSNAIHIQALSNFLKLILLVFSRLLRLSDQINNHIILAILKVTRLDTQ